MMLMLIYCALAAVTIFWVTLLKAYTHIPPKELKRRARSGDELAQLFFRVASYGPHAEILLWLLTGVSAAAFFYVVDYAMHPVAAIIASALLLWLSFAWIPHTPLSSLSLRLARFIAPVLAWVLQKIYVPMNWFVSLTTRFRMGYHTGLFDKDDLLELLKTQSEQPDSRVSPASLKLAMNSLVFGDKIVREVMTKRSKVFMVSADESLGPVLLTELHASGYSIFPVYEGKKNTGDVIGVAYLRDLSEGKPSGKVRDHVHSKMHFLHDETSLDAALQVFLRTKQHMYMVVNNLEEVVGVVTIDDILEQIVGQPIEDEFDAFDNPQAVAAYQKQKNSSEPASPQGQTVVESDQNDSSKD